MYLRVFTCINVSLHVFYVYLHVLCVYLQVFMCLHMYLCSSMSFTTPSTQKGHVGVRAGSVGTSSQEF